MLPRADIVAKLRGYRRQRYTLAASAQCQDLILASVCNAMFPPAPDLGSELHAMLRRSELTQRYFLRIDPNGTSIPPRAALYGKVVCFS